MPPGPRTRARHSSTRRVRTSCCGPCSPPRRVGAAYGATPHRAYGRLAAWRSLGGLTGCPADAPLAQVAERVRRTTWFHMDSAPGWFHGILWDLAVAALRPGGQEIAVLAATDTD
ncbi:DUF6183 family protein [Streptomyces sp. NPDC006733]|uniref:DUF6183 family protein n=1 Tax=Streptomyces sp. NPDC006733 TaxID=3155460 RepID=UPI0033CA67DD